MEAYANAILTHCIGVCDYWIGTLLGKRESFRDRDAEYGAGLLQMDWLGLAGVSLTKPPREKAGGKADFCPSASRWPGKVL